MTSNSQILLINQLLNRNLLIILKMMSELTIFMPNSTSWKTKKGILSLKNQAVATIWKKSINLLLWWVWVTFFAELVFFSSLSWSKILLRLCKVPDEGIAAITEECFQVGILKAEHLHDHLFPWISSPLLGLSSNSL